MNHALTFSLISHLRTQVPEVSNRVMWIYDGVTLSDTEKPFLSMESITSPQNAVIAAGRTDYSERYTWQVGVRARSMAERERLIETVISALRQRNIEFIDTRTNPPTASTQVFVVDVIRAVPMPSDDASNDTDKHRAYIDVECEIYRVNSDGLNFTQ